MNNKYTDKTARIPRLVSDMYSFFAFYVERVTIMSTHFYDKQYVLNPFDAFYTSIIPAYSICPLVQYMLDLKPDKLI